MKRRSITSGRVVLILPKDRNPFPRQCTNMLRDAYKQGRIAANRIHGKETVSKAAFPEMEALLTQTQGDMVKTMLVKTMFFTGLSMALRDLLEQMNVVTRAVKFNSDASGAYLQQMLTELLLHLDDVARLRLLHLFKKIHSLPEERWIITYMGALAVTRTAYALLCNGLKVYLPSPSEDVVWKIDLLARIPGESESYCFSIKSDRNVTTGAQVMFLDERRTANNTQRQQDFLQGVKRFTRYHQGCYVAVELFVSAREEDAERDYVLSQIIQRHRNLLVPVARRPQSTKIA